MLYLSASDAAMTARILERGKTSGRADDNAEAIKKRLNTFHEQTSPVVDYYSNIGKLREGRGIDG